MVDALSPGNTILLNALPGLIAQAEQVLNLIPWKRKHTLIRLDAGAGTIDSLHHLLSQGDAVVSKEYSAGRASRLVKSVTEWIDDPDQPGRQVGWGQEESLDYVRPVHRLALRSKSSTGGWRSAVLLFAGVAPKDILSLMGCSRQAEEATVMLTSAHLYDQRGGGMESSFGQDKSGLGIPTRHKKRCEAQRLLML